MIQGFDISMQKIDHVKFCLIFSDILNLCHIGCKTLSTAYLHRENQPRSKVNRQQLMSTLLFYDGISFLVS